ncbi:MAG: hypothetical protein IAE94_05330 [Chthoniobacterales bacterium]|nr:hypothetical protein [Chthoniobacterales bacterium]
MKVQWLRLPKLDSKALKAAGARILAAEYSDEKGIGFSVKEIRPSYLEGTFIHKVELSDTVEDPYGKEIIYERIEFRRIPFKISLVAPELEVVVPSRGISLFIGQLSVAFSMSFRIDPIQIEPFEVFDALKAEKDSLIASAVKINEITLSKSVSAKCTVSGANDVRPFIDRIAKGVTKSIASVKVIDSDKDKKEPSSCDIRRDGSVIFYGSADRIFLAPIRSIVGKLVSE